MTRNAGETPCRPAVGRRPRTRSARRGFTLIETLIAAVVTVITLGGLASLLSTAGVAFSRTTVQMDAEESAAVGAAQMMTDAREAKEIAIIEPHRFRIYYPPVTMDGRYNRFGTDYAAWVEYAQTDARGVPDSRGTYLWRKTAAGAGRAVARNVLGLEAVNETTRSLVITLRIRRVVGNRETAAEMRERVLYLRNH